MRNLSFVSGEIYHICNKSIGGDKVFLDPANKHRFLETALLVNGLDQRQLEWQREQFRLSGLFKIKNHERIVDIYALSLMPDHPHFLVSQKIEDGIPKFFQRLFNSFGKYYNTKYSRKGPLFIGPYKAIPIASESQAEHIFTYIHGNPLDLLDPSWREGRITKKDEAIKFLKNYEWSSLGIYENTVFANPIIKKIINTELAYNYFDEHYKYLDAIMDWGERNYLDMDKFE